MESAYWEVGIMGVDVMGVGVTRVGLMGVSVMGIYGFTMHHNGFTRVGHVFLWLTKIMTSQLT